MLGDLEASAMAYSKVISQAPNHTESRWGDVMNVVIPCLFNLVYYIIIMLYVICCLETQMVEAQLSY